MIDYNKEKVRFYGGVIMRYKAEMGLWMKIVFFIIPLVLIFQMTQIPATEWMYFIPTAVILAIFVAPLYFNAYYELNDEYLLINIGIYRMKVEYDNIKHISTGTMWRNTNTALKMNGVILELHKRVRFYKRILIATENDEAFIEELTRVCRELD